MGNQKSSAQKKYEPHGGNDQMRNEENAEPQTTRAVARRDIDQVSSGAAQNDVNTASVTDLVSAIAIMLKLFLLEEYEMHLSITCDGCGAENFIGYRYNCLVCDDYDLCDDCFQTRRTSKKHVPNHPVLVVASAIDRARIHTLRQIFEMDHDKMQSLLKDQVFSGITCDNCKQEPIKGVRLKCDDCFNFDLCWKCYKTDTTWHAHDKSHALIAHLWPVPTVFKLDKIKLVDEDENQNASSGCFGSVRKVSYENDVRALKLIKPDCEVNLQTFLNELRAYQEIRCNNIVRFFGCCVQQEPQRLCILMEYMHGGTLQSVITEKRDVSLRRKLQWLASIAKGLRCIHRKGFVHKDIKPDNILLNGHGDVKIGDMGIAIYDYGKEYFRNALAPFRYAAPEILLEEKFTNKVDMFSYGLLMNELLTYTAYPGLIPKVPVCFAVKAEIMWSLVESCVHAHANERPSAAQAAEQLETLLKRFWSSLKSSKDYMKLETSQKDDILLFFYRNLA